MCVSPLRALLMGTASWRQLRRREAGWGGSPRQILEGTNRKWIQGRFARVSWQWTVTPKDQPDGHDGKSAPDQRTDQCLTLGGLCVSWGDFPSSLVATSSDGRTEVSRGRSSGAGCQASKAKGRILSARSSLDDLDECGAAANGKRSTGPV